MYRFPEIVQRKLENGLQVLLVPDHEQEGLTVALQILVGEFSDPVSYEGTAELVVGLLQKGTQSLTTEQFAENLEQTGTMLFADTGDEHLVLGCKMLSRHADTVVPLFWEMLSHPRFDDKELDRLKHETVTALIAENSDPGALASRHFFSELCGKNHPAGRVHTAGSIKRINIDRIRSFYSGFFSPANSLLVVAGDFTVDHFDRTWASQCLRWENRSQALPVRGEPLSPLSKTTVRLIDKKDITQTYLMIGHPVPGELAGARNAMALANYILGGGNFSSRLMECIRSDKGKTYGISSQMLCNRQCGIFMISTATQSAQTEDVLKTIVRVYQEFSEGGVTDEELKKAREFAVGNMAFQLEGIGNIAEKLLWLRLYGRENSYIEHFDELISSIGKEEVDKAVRMHLSSKHFAMVAVGRSEEVRRQLEGFGETTSIPFRADP